MAKTGETSELKEDVVKVRATEVRYFSTVIGDRMGQDAPADVKRKIDGYLAAGWNIIYTLLKDDGQGLSVYHVLTR